MNKLPALAGVAIVSVGSLVALTLPADAGGGGRPFALIENIDFDAESFAFTALPPLCPEGSFTDDVTVVESTEDYLKLDISTVYTCADGSGRFNAHKRIKITFVSESTNFVTGTVRLTGGTGRFTGLQGAGEDNGTTVESRGQAAVTGVLRMHRS